MSRGLIEIRLQGEYRNDKKCCFLHVFVKKNTHKTHKIVKVAVINDNNNFAPSLFWSLCEFVGDCFAPSEKYLSPKQSPPISHNDLKKDGVQLLLSN